MGQPRADLRAQREATWRQLDDLVMRVERGGLRALDASSLAELPALYRATVSSLSVARATSLDGAMLAYLEALCARAYLIIYSPRRRPLEVVRAFALGGWSAQTYALRGYVLASALIMTLGVLAAATMTRDDPAMFYTFVDEAYAQGRGPHASTQALREVLFSGQDHAKDDLFRFASMLMTHNAKIGLMCAALGVAFGLPVLYLLFKNGLILGAFVGLYDSRGLSLELASWLLPHGVTELLAVILCGACGLALAESLIFPQRLGRRLSLARRGRQVAPVIVGAVLMFMLAGVIEGLFRQLVHDLEARFTLAGATAMFWAVYLGLYGALKHGQGQAARDPWQDAPAAQPWLASALEQGWGPDERALLTPEGVTLRLRVAPLALRAAALMVDLGVIVIGALTLTALTFLVLTGLDAVEVVEPWAAGLLGLGVFALRTFYFVAFEAAWSGRTPGKRLLGLRVIDQRGGALTMESLFARNLTRELELFLPLILLAGAESLWPAAPWAARLMAALWGLGLLALPLFNHDRLRAGDLLGGTMVVLQPKLVALSPREASPSAMRQAIFSFSEEQLDMYGVYELQVLEQLLSAWPDEATCLAVAEKIADKIACQDERWRRMPDPFLHDFYEALRARRERRMLFGDRQQSKKEGRLRRPSQG